MRTTILISLLFLSIHGLFNNKIQPKSRYNHSSIDTSRYAILKFNKENSYVFDKTDQSATLSTEEIIKVEKIIKNAVAKYNNKSGRYSYIDNPSKYYKQFIAVINAKGEKEVWANYFCEKSNMPYWRKGIVMVLDGGSCFFNVKINLTKNTIYDFMVNGVA